MALILKNYSLGAINFLKLMPLNPDTGWVPIIGFGDDRSGHLSYEQQSSFKSGTLYRVKHPVDERNERIILK